MYDKKEVIKEIKRRGYTSDTISPNKVNYIANELNIYLTEKEVVKISNKY